MITVISRRLNDKIIDIDMKLWRLYFDIDACDALIDDTSGAKREFYLKDSERIVNLIRKLENQNKFLRSLEIYQNDLNDDIIELQVDDDCPF